MPRRYATIAEEREEREGEGGEKGEQGEKEEGRDSEINQNLDGGVGVVALQFSTQRDIS